MSKQTTVRVTVEVNEDLTYLGQDWEMTKSEVIAQLIEEVDLEALTERLDRDRIAGKVKELYLEERGKVTTG